MAYTILRRRYFSETAKRGRVTYRLHAEVDQSMRGDRTRGAADHPEVPRWDARPVAEDRTDQRLADGRRTLPVRVPAAAGLPL